MKNGSAYMDAEFIMSELMNEDWRRGLFCDMYHDALLKISGVESVDLFSKCFPVLAVRIERLIASQINSVDPSDRHSQSTPESMLVDITRLGTHGPMTGIRRCRANVNSGTAYLYRDNNLDDVIAAYEDAME